MKGNQYDWYGEITPGTRKKLEVICEEFNCSYTERSQGDKAYFMLQNVSEQNSIELATKHRKLGVDISTDYPIKQAHKIIALNMKVTPKELVNIFWPST